MVDESQSKLTTVSVRVEEDLLNRVETVSNLLSISKSDFLRACLEKLCRDNRILVEHENKVAEYACYVKEEFSKLPADLIEIKNGTWNDLSESTITMLCDELWKWSEAVYNFWVEFTGDYSLGKRY